NFQVLFFRRGARMIGLIVRWEIAALHVRAIFAYCARDNLADIGVLARKFWCLLEGQAEEIVDDQDLAVAVWTGSDADGGDTQLAGDLRGEFAGDGFEDYREGASCFHG